MFLDMDRPETRNMLRIKLPCFDIVVIGIRIVVSTIVTGVVVTGVVVQAGSYCVSSSICENTKH